jgi:nicotinamidase-related amidase
MPLKVDLLIIDPQVDFCDPKGSLFVKGADDDMKRVAGLIKRIGPKLNDIHVTMDTHHFVDIAHPVYWKDSSGSHPAPFTIITKDDVKNGKWVTSLPSLQKRALDYVTQLDKNARYPLCIWPPHCLIGSEGHKVQPDVFEALLKWETDNFAMVDYVTKGSNIYTEHYSAIKADVPDAADPSTQINTDLIKTLMDTDIIAIMGEASSHCVANTVRDIANEFGDDSHVKKMVFIEDGTSPVPGFENMASDFVKEMTGRGMQLSTSTEFLK